MMKINGNRMGYNGDITNIKQQKWWCNQCNRGADITGIKPTSG